MAIVPKKRRKTGLSAEAWREVFKKAVAYCKQNRVPGERIQTCVGRVLRQYTAPAPASPFGL